MDRPILSGPDNDNNNEYDLAKKAIANIHSRNLSTKVASIVAHHNELLTQ